MKKEFSELKPYLLLWGTQSLSALGSGMTGYALVLWLYRETDSALETALLSVCTYAPYVLVGIFAGALSDRWNKKRTMLVCDALAAAGSAAALVLVRANALVPWHLYLLNALSGLMNAVQQPASEVAATRMVPREYYQKTSGLRSFSSSLNSILTPVFATALFALLGMEAVIAFDLLTFAAAFVSLLCFIRVPEPAVPRAGEEKESVLSLAASGLRWLRGDPLVAKLILFLAAVNFFASIYDAALPARFLPREGGEETLGLLNACVGAATLFGSVLAAVLPRPKNRVAVICGTLFVSLTAENLLLAFGKTAGAWCVGAVLGWAVVPLMNANLDVILRVEIPAEMQGRVYACRNSLQFFTIPLGLFSGGFLVDRVFEPLLSAQPETGLLRRLFGAEKGAGAAALFFFLALCGAAVCAVFAFLLRKYRWTEDGAPRQ